MDHFTLFGLPVSVPVDGSLLALNYQALQRQYHPDRFAAGTDSERLMAAQKAAQINDAYQTLKNPLISCEYILSLHGIDVLSEQQSVYDSDFLMHQMMLREELEQIEQQHDVDQLLQFSQQIDAMMHHQYHQLLELISDGQWEIAGESARKIRFIAKLQQQIELIEERILEL